MTNLTPTDPEFQDQDEWRRERDITPTESIHKCVETKFMPFSEWQLERQLEAERQQSKKLSPEQVQELVEQLNESPTKQTLDSAWEQFKKTNKKREDALVAQRSEQDAHNVLVTGSSPVEGTTILPARLHDSRDPVGRLSAMDGRPLDVEEKCAIYEYALTKIISITKVDTPADRSAESFFFVAAGMRQQAIKALKKAGVI